MFGGKVLQWPPLQSVRREESELQSVRERERASQADLFANGIGPAGLGVMDGMLVALHSMLLILLLASTFKGELLVSPKPKPKGNQVWHCTCSVVAMHCLQKLQ